MSNLFQVVLIDGISTSYNPHPATCAEWGLQFLDLNDGGTYDEEN